MNRFRDHVGSVKLIAGDSGSFEVKLNGEQIYSKWDTGKYPELKEITDQVEATIKAPV